MAIIKEPIMAVGDEVFQQLQLLDVMMGNQDTIVILPSVHRLSNTHASSAYRFWNSHKNRFAMIACDENRKEVEVYLATEAEMVKEGRTILFPLKTIAGKYRFEETGVMSEVIHTFLTESGLGNKN